MAFGAKEIILYIRRTSHIFVHDHPFAIGMVFFVVILYRFFPSLFVFLVSSSPVIVCTALLLGIILIYGEPNIPEVEEEDRKTQRLSPFRVGAVVNVEGRRETKEMAVREDVLGDGRATGGCKAAVQDERYGRGDSSMAASSLADEDKKENYGKKVSEKDKKIRGHGITKKKKSSSEKLAAGGARAGKDIEGAINSNQKKARDLKKGVRRPNSNDGLDPSLGSSRHHVDHHDASSGSETDRAESSSPDATSVSDIMPVLDELHPLLDSEAPQPALVSKDNSDDASVESSDNGSAEEEAENQEDEDDEGQEDKDDETKPVVTWTADDQKNLVELKNSELERNRRLENVIAKQRARKLMEKNLIDLDSNVSLPSIEELSRFQVQIPPVFAPRRNPFDLPYDADEIPGSAPSRLLPRRNPFDLPSEQPDETGSSMAENLSHQEVLTNPQRDILFTRHESFTSGALFIEDITQERHISRFKPYFVAERTDAEEAGFADDQRESSEQSDSKVSYPKSVAASLVTEQESHEDLPEQELHQESASLAYHVAEPSERESQSSDEADSVDIEQVQSGINPSDDHSMVMEDTHQAAEAFRKVGEETNEELEQNAIISYSEKAVVIDEKYESGTSTSSEGNDKSTEASIHEQAASLEQTFTAGSDIHGREVERVDDSQVVEPVYDSSPSAIEKTQSNVSALDEALLGAGKGGSNSHNSSMSDVQADVSLVHSPPRTSQKNDSLGERTREELASAGEMFWVASSLASVEENESRSREISEIRERDVIGDELSGVHDDLFYPIVPMLPKASSERQLRRSSLSSRRSSLPSRRSSLSSVESESSEGTLN